MSTRTYSTSGHIDNTPEAVIAYVADPRKRPLFFPSLKSVSDIKGEPTAVGTTWKWTFSALGFDFQGAGRCTQHEPGKVYAFKTEGGIDSTFTYRAEADGKGTRLTIDLQYTVPDHMLTKLPATAVADAMKKAEAERVMQNLQHILNQ
jgi:carbon monoxide dehydrogenase subunit G